MEHKLFNYINTLDETNCEAVVDLVSNNDYKHYVFIIAKNKNNGTALSLISVIENITNATISDDVILNNIRSSAMLPVLLELSADKTKPNITDTEYVLHELAICNTEVSIDMNDHDSFKSVHICSVTRPFVIGFIKSAKIETVENIKELINFDNTNMGVSYVTIHKNKFDIKDGKFVLLDDKDPSVDVATLPIWREIAEKAYTLVRMYERTNNLPTKKLWHELSEGSKQLVSQSAYSIYAKGPSPDNAPVRNITGTKSERAIAFEAAVMELCALHINDIKPLKSSEVSAPTDFVEVL